MVRVAVHSGNCDYTNNKEEIVKLEPVKKVIEIEAKYTKPNTVTISANVQSSIEPLIADELTPVASKNKMGLYNYAMEWEN